MKKIIFIILYIIECFVAILLIINPFIEFWNSNYISGIILLLGIPLGIGLITLPLALININNIKQ